MKCFPGRNLVVLALLLLLTGSARAADAPLSFRFAVLGGEPEREDSQAALAFIEQLNLRWPAGARKDAGAWEQLQWRAAPGSPGWSLVLVLHQSRRDWFALQFDDAGQTLLRAAHRPARPPRPGARRDGILPGPQQVSENAVIELAADVQQLLAGGDRGAPPQRLRLVIEPWDGNDAEAFLLGDDAGDRAPTKPLPAGLLSAWQALSTASAFAADLAVTTDPAAPELKLQVGQRPDGYTLRAIWGEQTRRLVRVPTMAIPDHVTALLRWATQWQDRVAAVRQVEEGPAQVLGRDGDHLLVRIDGELWCWNPADGKAKWKAPATTGTAPLSYAVSTDATGAALAILQTAPSCALLNRQTGRPTPIALPDRGGVEQLAALPDGTVLIAQNQTLIACADGNERWRAVLPLPGVTALAADSRQVAVGGLDGSVHLLKAADGQLIWRSAPQPTAVTALLMSEPGLLRFDRAGAVQFLKRADGQVQGQETAGPPLAFRQVGSEMHWLDRERGWHHVNPATQQMRTTELAGQWRWGGQIASDGQTAWVLHGSGRLTLQQGKEALTTLQLVDLARGPLIDVAGVPGGNPGGSPGECWVGDERGFVYHVRPRAGADQ